MYPHPLIKGQKGFTLIELVLVITILGIAVSALMTYFVQGVGTSSQSQQRTVASTLAQALMEEIISKCWDETSTTVSPCQGAVTPSTVGADGGEGRQLYDDVDDFNGMNNLPPQDSQGGSMTAYSGYSQQATVCYVDSSALNTCKGSGVSNYKKIVVDIVYGGGEKAELVTMVANY
jgi:MSHA pilin protein MshD